METPYTIPFPAVHAVSSDWFAIATLAVTWLGIQLQLSLHAA